MSIKMSSIVNEQIRIRTGVVQTGGGEGEHRKGGRVCTDRVAKTKKIIERTKANLEG